MEQQSSQASNSTITATATITTTVKSPTAGGFEASFVDDVPEYLLCLLCHLPLCNPVQILTCGHKMCEQCYNQLKVFAHAQKTPLLCPVDRDVVDEKQVFADKGLERVVGNLMVRCGNAGCQWTGHLRDLSGHEDTCQFQVPHTNDVDEVSIKEMIQRLERCEERMVQREKDLTDLKKDLEDKMKETEVMKERNDLIEDTLTQVKNEHEEQLSQLQIKMENLSLKNALLEQKVEMLRKDTAVAKEESSKNGVIVEMLRNQITAPKAEKIEEEETIEALEENELPVIAEPLYEEISLMQLQLLQQQYDQKRHEQTEELSAVPVDDVVSDVLRKAKGKSSKPDKTVNKSEKSLKDELKRVQESVQKLFNESNERSSKLTFKITNIEKELKRRPPQSPEPKSSAIAKEELHRKIDLIKEHITNLENVMFCGRQSISGNNSSLSSSDVVLQWRLHNYHHHYNNGEEVYSPVFLTQLKGYRFQLIVDWSGKNREYMGLHLRLTRGVDESEQMILEPYNIPFMLQIEDMHGNVTSEKVSLDDIRANRRDCFSISAGKKQAARSYGLSEFCSGGDVLRCLVNDMLFIRCVLSPLSDNNYDLLNNNRMIGEER